MTPIENIYLDIDGVLNMMPFDALSYVLGEKITAYPLPGNYNLVDACRALSPFQFTDEEFWECLDRKFWADIPPTSECNWLPELCSQMVGRKHVFLLTAPVIDPDCVAGKVEWIYKNLPSWLHRQFLIGPKKWICARPGALLIDDYDENVQKFEIYGGETVLVPRPWNSMFSQFTRS